MDTPVPQISRAVQVEAARQYMRARRRFWRSMVVMMSAFAVGLALMEIGSWLNACAALCCAVVCWGCGVLFWISCVVDYFTMSGLACPRCGKKFGAYHISSHASEHCQHCGLELSPEVAAEGG